MYAKVLVEGDRDQPLVIVSVQRDSGLVPQLHRHGWSLFGSQIKEAPGARIALLPSFFAIYVDDSCVFSEPSNSSAPDECWWNVVESLGSQAIVVIAEHGEIDLEAADITEQLDALMDNPSTAQAFLPVLRCIW